MRPFLLLVCALGLFTSPGRAQQLYFPPLTGSAWETISPSSLGWRTDQIDSLEHFLVQIYDMQGKEIESLINEDQTRGDYTVRFNGGGKSSGIYFYTLTQEDFSVTKKMLLLK